MAANGHYLGKTDGIGEGPEAGEEQAETPAQEAERWQMEFAAARKELEKWHEKGDAIVKRFKDDRGDTDTDVRWNLFTSNVQTQRCMLFGKTPRVDVARKFGDANDDTARVAAEMAERLLNTDIQRDSDTFAFALECALSDRMLPGLGNARVRYVASFEQVAGKEAVLDEATGEILAEAVEETERKASEDVEVDYIPWKDQLWSAGARTETERRWWAHKSQLSRKELVRRFGNVGRRVPLNSKANAAKLDGPGKEEHWGRADVWEIWSKEERKVFWFVEGFGETLDRRPDPLGLDGFWPFPRPMTANLATDSLVPVPDWHLARDLYTEIDHVSTRVQLLMESLRVAGAYDKSAGSQLEGLVNGRENRLIPVDNWAMFAEKGGLRGVVDWFPIEQVAGTVTQLRDYRSELVATLYQVTGMSDVFRGQQVENGTPGEAAVKARFASVRMQALQDEFARFASDLQRLKFEIIAKHFDAQTILERSNVQYTPDAQLAGAAVELIKSRYAHYRVEVKPENVNLTDFASMKQERVEFMTALATFFQAATPIGQLMPGALPFLLELLKWTMSGLKGANTAEGILDRAIASAQQLPPGGPQQAQGPDPKLLAQQLKSQGELAKVDKELQADLVRLQAETQAKQMQEQQQAIANIAEARAKHAITRGLGGSGPAFTPGGMP
jgi:hypothetical protein